MYSVCDISKFSNRGHYLLHINREDFKIEVAISNFLEDLTVKEVEEWNCCSFKIFEHLSLLLRIPALYRLLDVIVRAGRSWALYYFDPLVYDWKEKVQLSSSTSCDDTEEEK